MLLAIDASRAADPQKTGVGWYTYRLLANLRSVIPDHVGVVLYSDRPLPHELRPWPAQWSEQVLAWPPHPASHILRHTASVRWPLWSQVRLAARVLSDRPDALFIPSHVIPDALSWRRRMSARPKLVTTIHDVVFRRYPETYSRRERWYADRATRIAVRTADQVIVPTFHVRDDLIRFYRADPAQMVVIPHGVDPHIPSPSHSPFSIPHSPFLLYVGRLERKKNIFRMVEAFERIAAQFPDVQFVFAGSRGYGYEEITARIVRSPFRDRIQTPGWIDGITCGALLSHATAFCFPTLSEGFGMPILEAFAAGVPVLTSSSGAQAEVAGDAAFLVDPHDPEAIAEGLQRLLSNAELRRQLVDRGQQRAWSFTWQQSAQRTWEAIRSVLSA